MDCIRFTMNWGIHQGIVFSLNGFVLPSKKAVYKLKNGDKVTFINCKQMYLHLSMAHISKSELLCSQVGFSLNSNLLQSNV